MVLVNWLLVLVWRALLLSGKLSALRRFFLKQKDTNAK
jgi:hypothetical protein